MSAVEAYVHKKSRTDSPLFPFYPKYAKNLGCTISQQTQMHSDLPITPRIERLTVAKTTTYITTVDTPQRPY